MIMRNKLFYLTISVFILTLCSAAQAADVVELKSGVTLEGKIVDKSDNSITVQMQDGDQIPYMMSEVAVINGKKVKSKFDQTVDSSESSDDLSKPSDDSGKDSGMDLDKASDKDLDKDSGKDSDKDSDKDSGRDSDNS